VHTAEQTSPTLPTSRKVLCAIYGVIALAALIGTWSQNVAYTHNAAGFLLNFLRDTKVTAASRSINVDIVLFLLAAAILMVIEARKHNVRFVWLYILGGFAIAISVTFPLFLIARELRLPASEPPRLKPLDTILLALVATGVGALAIWVDVL